MGVYIKVFFLEGWGWDFEFKYVGHVMSNASRVGLSPREPTLFLHPNDTELEVGPKSQPDGWKQF